VTKAIALRRYPRFFLGRRSARLACLTQALRAMADGDLTVFIPSTAGDELGALERAVEAVLAQMQQIVGTVQEGVERFHVDRLSVADVNKMMLDSAETTAGQAYDVGLSAQQVSESIHVVASSTEELSVTISEIARHASLASEIATSAAAEGQVADKSVRDLGAALNQVEDIANVINSIASQTHLLALNATIEAARAGSAGRGFAIVAAEVKQLARSTAEATKQVRDVVAGIHADSQRASQGIGQISVTMARICESTSSIAAAVNQQTSTTREIGRVSIVAAHSAEEISRRVSEVHDRARELAYIGASNGATKSKDFAILEGAFRAAVSGFQMGEFVAVIEAEDEPHTNQAQLNAIGTSTTLGVTTVLDTVTGDGLLEFQYFGSWLHGSGYETDPGGDAYSCVPGDEITIRFVGRRLKFYGYKDKQQGIAEIWIDSTTHTLIDFYSADRSQSMMWESEQLTDGEHVLHVVVSPTKNRESRYFWVSLAKVEISVA
jgi:methyl-accepting chemotaxis protein